MSSVEVSVILRSHNEGWALRETLEALQAQNHRAWELIAFDSGSTDGSAELIARAKPAHFIAIPPEQYNPSRVINQGMCLARTPFGIFLNADATPQGPDWLAPLAQALQKPETAAAFSRQVPRPDCRAVFACDYERCFGPNRESARWEHFFSMVSSGLRKDLWARRGFLETLQYAEDDEYTRWAKAAGLKVVYCPESVVMHSHNYTPREAYRRSFGDARALAASWPGSPRHFSWWRALLCGWLNDVRRDFVFCWRRARLRELPHAGVIRWQQRRGRWAGFHEGWRVHRQEAA